MAFTSATTDIAVNQKKNIIQQSYAYIRKCLSLFGINKDS